MATTNPNASLIKWLTDSLAADTAQQKATTAKTIKTALQIRMDSTKAWLAVLSTPAPPTYPDVAPAMPVLISVVRTDNSAAVTMKPVTDLNFGITQGFNIYRNGAQVAWPEIYDLTAQADLGVPIVANGDGSYTYTDSNGMNSVGNGLDQNAHTYYISAYNGKGSGTATTVVNLAAPAGPPVVTPPPVGTGTVSLGTYAWNQTVVVTVGYANKLGIPKYDFALVHMDMSNWTSLQSVWFAGEWANAGYQMIITFAPFPNGNTLAQAAAGQFVSQWKAMLSAIAATFPNAILRFAHEFNCCYPWGVHNATDLANYLKMWQLWVPLVRAYPGLKTCWNPINGGGSMGGSTVEQAYPGDNLVDFVGWDGYTTNKGWSDIANGPYGLTWVSAFAGQHNKKVILCETAVADYVHVPAQNSGDYATYVTNLAAYVKDPVNNIAILIYYEDDNADIRSCIDDPERKACMAAYIKGFGTVAPKARKLVRVAFKDRDLSIAAHSAASALLAAKNCEQVAA